MELQLQDFRLQSKSKIPSNLLRQMKFCGLQPGLRCQLDGESPGQPVLHHACCRADYLGSCWDLDVLPSSSLLPSVVFR